MDDDTRQKIFDPFFTTKPSGHGLGLAAVQGIARQHGGMIGVRSAVGVGTTFTFLLPPATGAAPATQSAPVPARKWALAGAVLVIDDEDAVRSLARRILERHSIMALEAANGQAALDIFAEHAGQIAAVLLDLTMPKMSGAEVLHALRAIRPDLPVLLTSGYSEQATLGWDLEGGRIGFIQKPYRPQELLDKLYELLG
jgi:CheY-like chemotaxis protein